MYFSASNFEVYKIGGVSIAPPSLDADIIIDTSRTFPANHQSTVVALRLIDKLKPEGSLLDIGAGSGILSIFAHKKGFKDIYITERDEASLHLCKQNMYNNHVELVEWNKEPVDVCIINICGADSIAARLNIRPKYYVLSAYKGERQDPFMYGYKVIDYEEQDTWWAVLLERDD